jgi:hypothetical protein
MVVNGAKPKIIETESILAKSRMECAMDTEKLKTIWATFLKENDVALESNYWTKIQEPRLQCGKVGATKAIILKQAVMDSKAQVLSKEKRERDQLTLRQQMGMRNT